MSELPLGQYRRRRETEKEDVQNDYWTLRLGKFVSVAEIAILRRQFRKDFKVAAWERHNRLVPYQGKLCLAYKVPGTEEAKIATAILNQMERFIASKLKGE